MAKENEDNKGLQLGCNLLATKILKEYVSFIQVGMIVEIEAFTKHQVAKMIEDPTEEFQNQVLDQVLRLMRIRSGGRNNSRQ